VTGTVSSQEHSASGPSKDGLHQEPARQPGTVCHRATPESSDSWGRVGATALATRGRTVARHIGVWGAEPPSEGNSLRGGGRVPREVYSSRKLLTTWEKPDRVNRLRSMALGLCKARWASSRTRKWPGRLGPPRPLPRLRRWNPQTFGGVESTKSRVPEARVPKRDLALTLPFGSGKQWTGA
jgi:hypothetical protein